MSSWVVLSAGAPWTNKYFDSWFTVYTLTFFSSLLNLNWSASKWWQQTCILVYLWHVSLVAKPCEGTDPTNFYVRTVPVWLLWMFVWNSQPWHLVSTVFCCKPFVANSSTRLDPIQRHPKRGLVQFIMNSIALLYLGYDNKKIILSLVSGGFFLTWTENRSFSLLHHFSSKGLAEGLKSLGFHFFPSP